MDEKLASRISVGIIIAGGICTLLLFQSLFPSFSFFGTLLLLVVSLGCAYEAAQYSEETFIRRGISFLLYSLPALVLIISVLFFKISHDETAISTELQLVNLKGFAVGIVMSILFSLLWVIYTLRDSLFDAEKFLSKFFLNYIITGVGGASAVFVSLHAQAPKLIFISGAIVALSDVVAYFVGPRFSSVKLAIGISPHKAVAGSLAAILVGALVGGALGILFLDRGVLYGACLGFVLSFVSVLFDLSQSLSKRLSGVKDSGTLLRAHGGIFDRFDSHLGGMMVMALFILIFT